MCKKYIIYILLCLGCLGLNGAFADEPAMAQTIEMAVEETISEVASAFCADVNEIPQTECEALVALYQSTDGDNWRDNTGWLTTNTPCSWVGVTCADGHVTELALVALDLFGTLPAELGSLTRLVKLDLNSNRLSGPIPSEFGDFPNLKILFLYSNRLSGDIPSELGNLANLTDMRLYSNQLSGVIPSELGDLANLTCLYLSYNQLTGTIPSELGSLTNLTCLYLKNNQLSGTIPSELGNLTNLVYLYLDGNLLSGVIPSEMGNLTNLSYLYLYSNLLSGAIPSELGDLTKLTRLYLNENQLSGTIPSELGNLTNLRYFYLNENQLSGAIPSELGNLTNLKYFYLNENQLSGTVPSELGNLIKLTRLYLNENQLSGVIPSELGNLISLTHFHFRNNRLSGTIPPELGNLTSLTYLHLGNNQLSGNIPSSLINLINLTDIRLYSNRLSGDIPSGLGNLTKLAYLLLYSNQLSGNIPPELGNITSLREILLFSNRLSGSVPSELCNTKSAYIANFSSNDLTGPLPSCLINSSLASLGFIDTGICEPTAPEFQAWLEALQSLDRTNALCEGSVLALSIAPSNQTAHPGNSIIYSLIITATEESTVVILTNPLPSELGNIENISGATYDTDDHQIFYQGTVEPGTPHRITYTSQLDDGVTPGTVILNSALLSGTGIVQERSASVAVESDGRQTLMLVYAVGDNNLADEMLRALNNAEQGAGNPNITIRFLLDGPGADDTYVFNLAYDQDPRCPNYTNISCDGRYVLGQNVWKWTDNTASPYSLSEFVSSSIHAYPNAPAVYLVVSGHGGGWGASALPAQAKRWMDQGEPVVDTLGGHLWDDHPHGSLSTKGLGQGLTWAYEATSKRIDGIYMDLCNGAQLEIAYEIHDSANYLLASEATTWTNFAYHHMFNMIDGTRTPREVLLAWHEIESKAFSTEDYPFTMSLMDLNKLEAVITAQNGLVEKLIVDLSPKKAKIIKAIEQTDCFDTDYNGSINSAQDNYCDLASFAKQIASTFADEPGIVQAAQSVNAAIKDAVIANDFFSAVPWVHPEYVWNWQELGGIGGYLPFRQDEWKRRYYTDEQLKINKKWRLDNLIHLFWEDNNARRLTTVEEPPICPDDCDGLAKPLPIRPELQTSESITVSSGNSVHLPVSLIGYGYDLVNAAMDVTFDDSCLSLTYIQFNLPSGFTGEYNVVGDNTIEVAVSTAATPPPSLLDDTIATLDFTATCSTSVTVTNAIFEDVNQNSIDSLTNSTEVYVVEAAEIILDSNDDSEQVVRSGEWVLSDAIKPPYGPNYFHDDNALKGENSVQFLPDIPTACGYQVDMYWTAAGNRATNVPVDIVHNAGTDTVYVNQQINGSQWNTLGVYILSPDANVLVRTDGTDGHVIVDAMRFRPILPCTNLTLPTISIRPEHGRVIQSSIMSDTITIDFVIENIADLYAGQIKVEYDNTILDALDSDPTKPGPQLEHGNFLPADKEIHNVIDQANSLIIYTISLQGGVPGVNGSGLFVRAHFRVIGSGVSPLSFTYTAFNTSLPKPIPVSLQNSQIEVIANTLSLTGTVTLEGQPDPSNVTVCVAQNCTTTDSNGFYTLESVPITGTVEFSIPGYMTLTQPYSGTPGETLALLDMELPIVSTTLSNSGFVTDTHKENHSGIVVCLNDSNCTQTEADGSYSFTDVPITGTITYAKPHYLTATVSYKGKPGVHIYLPGIYMRGGDVNQDGEVSDVDATTIGLAWGSKPGDPNWDARADLYQDNFIDVTDMTFVQIQWRHESEIFYVGNAAPRRSRSGVQRVTHPLPGMTQDNTQVWVEPTQQVASSMGEEITAGIWVKNVEDLYSFNVVLNFDPTVLKVHHQDDLRVGEFLNPIHQFVVVNDFDNEKGHVELMVTQLHPAESRSGDGRLGSVVFESVAAGDGQIRIAEAVLRDNSTPDPVAIPVHVDLDLNIYMPLFFNE